MRRYLREFVSLGLIAVEMGVHQANTFLLLAIAPAQGSESAPSPAQPATAPLQQRANRVVIGDSPNQAADGQAKRSRVASGDNQESRIDKPRKNKPTNRSAGVANVAQDGGLRRAISANPITLIPARKANPSVHSPQPSVLTAEQEAAARSLSGIGVRRSVADTTARCHSPADVQAWVRYALRQASLRSKAGLVLAMLQAGEQPPTLGVGGYVQSYAADFFPPSIARQLAS